ncbi:MAG: AAA family ATPase [Candidatus Uhrbacteria bacterium]
MEAPVCAPRPDPQFPAWAEELRRKYLRGEASQFVLHGNVHDLILFNGDPITLREFLIEHLLRDNKSTIVTFNTAEGLRFAKCEERKDVIDPATIGKNAEKALTCIEHILFGDYDRVAIVLDYAETLVPAADIAMSSESDRRAAVMLHRWSLERSIQQKDCVVILISEVLSDLNAKLLSNPKVSAIRVPFPDDEERARVIRRVAPTIDDANLARLAGLTAGLKAVQIENILAPNEPPGEDEQARIAFIMSLLSGTADVVEQRAKRFALMTNGMTREEIRALIQPDAVPADDAPKPVAEEDPYAEVVRLVNMRKREIIEKECFGLVQFVEPEHGFEAVGGMRQIKEILQRIAENICLGNRNRVPMGVLFVGPMGTGKTYVAEAFAKESGLTAIKFKNFRSKWVGSTEANLEKILTIVQALGNVLVIIDEGDRAFGGSGDSDGGTSSRVIARIKEFMSDTSNRGRILFILMTNRPDKLDIDIKRAGRLDRKIPFFYADDASEIEAVLLASMRKNRVRHEVEFPRDRDTVSAKLVGYSNADLEAIVLLANEYAHDNGSAGVVQTKHLQHATESYLASRDLKMLEFMELQAVFEASNRELLPKKFQGITVEELQQRLDCLRQEIYHKGRLHI